MKKLLCTAALIGLLVPAIGAQGQSTPPAQEKKPEAKAAPSPAGKWDVTAQTQQGTLPSTLDLKLDGKKVTGLMASQMGEVPVQGEFADGKLRFSISIQSNSGSVEVVFNAAFKEDGSLAGTFDYGQGPMTWTATRAKG